MKKIINNLKLTRKDWIFILLTLVSLVFSKLADVSMQWLTLGILLVFIGVYLRERFVYIISVFTFLVIFFVLTSNPTAYNFYFKVLMIVISVGLFVTLLEDIINKISKSS